VLKAYWSEGKDIHDWSVLEAAAAQAGVDAVVMRDTVDAGLWKRAVDERVEAAHLAGVHAVPTFLVENRVIIQGAQPADVFRQALRKL
jgi:protein disulfide-isomerase